MSNSTVVNGSGCDIWTVGGIVLHYNRLVCGKVAGIQKLLHRVIFFGIAEPFSCCYTLFFCMDGRGKGAFHTKFGRVYVSRAPVSWPSYFRFSISEPCFAASERREWFYRTKMTSHEGFVYSWTDLCSTVAFRRRAFPQFLIWSSPTTQINLGAITNTLELVARDFGNSHKRRICQRHWRWRAQCWANGGTPIRRGGL